MNRIPIAHVLYPGKGEKIFKQYSDILMDIKLLKSGAYDLKEDNKRLAEKNKRAETHIKNLKDQLEETQRKLDRNTKLNADLVAKFLTKLDKLKNETDNLNEEKKEPYRHG